MPHLTNTVYQDPGTRALHQDTLAPALKGLTSFRYQNEPSSKSDRGRRTNCNLLFGGSSLRNSRQHCATANLDRTLLETTTLSSEALASWHMFQGPEALRSPRHQHIHIIFHGRQAETSWRWPRVFASSTRPMNTTNPGQRHHRKNTNLWIPRKIKGPKYITLWKMQFPSQMARQHQQLQHLCRFPT